jgi:hypothetical protein
VVAHAKVFQKIQKYFFNVKQQKSTNQKIGNTRKTRGKTKKYINIYTKRHLGYLRHFEESPQTKTDSFNGDKYKNNKNR